MRLAFLVLAVALVRPAYAQKAADHIALGVAAEHALKPEEALQHFEAALASDTLNYEANWRAAVAVTEIAELPDPSTPVDKDSVYKVAEQYARRALAIDGTRAEGHFAVALTVGYISLNSGPLERLDYAPEIWEEATTTLKIDPKHDGAYHVLGRWYGEIMRLSMLEASVAKGSLGKIAEDASWDLAIKNLERAVELAPSFIYHRLDLAHAYMDTKRTAEARAQLLKIDSLSVSDVRDPVYKSQAKTWLEKLKA